ncbi:PHP domain-containing protein [Candidatus Woesearchaeota archaeon]|nr:MAG: PHP domain-containing protein [Candidatus Woesearchaeota archaeon]
MRVRFGKPCIEELKRSGFSAVDMHFHTGYTDNIVSVKSLLRRSERLGIGVAITDHNDVRGAIDAFKLNKKGLLVIPGIEVTCRTESHALLYFYALDELIEFFEKHVKSKRTRLHYGITRLSTPELLDITKDYNCVRVIAHPFASGGFGIGRAVSKGVLKKSVFKEFDAIEGINGQTLMGFNKKAVKKAEELGKPVTGGSDGHSVVMLGRVVTYSKAYGIEEFLNSIKKNKACVVGKKAPLALQALTYPGMLLRHLQHFGPYVENKYRALFDRPL